MVKPRSESGGQNPDWRRQHHVAKLGVPRVLEGSGVSFGDTHAGDLPDAAPDEIIQPEPPIEQFAQRPDDN